MVSFRKYLHVKMKVELKVAMVMGSISRERK